MTDKEKVATPKRGGWFEEYRCGCVSEYVDTKADLLGYCPTHGQDRRRVYHVPTPRPKKEQA